MFRLAVTLLFAFQGFAMAQTQSAAAPPRIKTSITIDSTTLSPDKPAIVTIERRVERGSSFGQVSLPEEFAGFATL